MGQQHPAEQDQELPGGRGYGALLATPTQADIEQARITDYARWLGDGPAPQVVVSGREN